MNPVYLEIRTHKPNDVEVWTTVPTPFPSYHDAILAGQETAPRNFMVNTGSRVPSRKEQLLFDSVKDFGFSDLADSPPKRKGRPGRTAKMLAEL